MVSPDLDHFSHLREEPVVQLRTDLLAEDEHLPQGKPAWILDLGWCLVGRFVVDEREAPHSPVLVEEQDSVVAVRPEQEQPDLMADTLDWDTSSAAWAFRAV